MPSYCEQAPTAIASALCSLRGAYLRDGGCYRTQLMVIVAA